jgi:hypothetical protein
MSVIPTVFKSDEKDGHFYQLYPLFSQFMISSKLMFFKLAVWKKN